MRKKKYIDYDYENEFRDNLDLLNEDEIKRLLDKRRITSVYATKTVKSGNQFEIEIYPEFTRTEAKQYDLKKKPNQSMKNLNDRNARKRLERLINANFKEGDLWITFTYDNKHLPRNEKEALNNMENFMRRINYRRKKEGLGLAKYIYVTEFSEDKKLRCHHHLIMDNGLNMETVESMWKCGKRNNVRKVAPDENGLTGLANYLAKDPKGKKRWCSSKKNLKKPAERKSYTVFRGSHVKKMVQDFNSIEMMTERKYKTKRFLNAEIRYNPINCRFYIYIRMKEINERSNQ